MSFDLGAKYAVQGEGGMFFFFLERHVWLTDLFVDLYPWSSKVTRNKHKILN